MNDVIVEINHPTLGEDDFSFTPNTYESIDKQIQDIVDKDYPEPGTTWRIIDEQGNPI